MWMSSPHAKQVRSIAAVANGHGLIPLRGENRAIFCFKLKMSAESRLIAKVRIRPPEFPTCKWAIAAVAVCGLRSCPTCTPGLFADAAKSGFSSGSVNQEIAQDGEISCLYPRMPVSGYDSIPMSSS
jgi:hypothetical protein